MKPRVVIIVPTYNERENIYPLVRALAKVFRAVTTYECILLVVDDQSPDGTAKEVIAQSHKYTWIKLLKNKHKLGLGHAYKVSMRYALDKLGADIIFEFDADLSHDPNMIPPFLKKIELGADIVLGTRYVRGGGIPRDWPWYRKFLSVVGNMFIKIVMINFRITDWTTGYRALRREVVENILPQLRESIFNGYTWQIGSLFKSLELGYKVEEVPFYFIDRTRGQSKMGLEYFLNTLMYVLKSRIKQIVHSRFLKFALIGGMGALIQLVALHIYRRILLIPGVWVLSEYQVSLLLAIETSIVSNFIWNNFWTFRDRKLKALQIPGKFIQFNLTSGGSILIQFFIASAGEHLIGLFNIFETAVAGRSISLDTGAVYAIVGILVGMFWNFFAYTHIIWKKK